ncbi:MAG: class I SAM-dependent methyltransferase, partial [Vicinamibacteria bacterium]
FDIVYSISTIEHIAPGEHQSLMTEIGRVLKPGGRCVLTVDLFLNLAPFTDRVENEFGVNVDVAGLCECSGLALVSGDRAELLGFPEFSAKEVLANLGGTLFGANPSLAQCLVLSKEATLQSR